MTVYAPQRHSKPVWPWFVGALVVFGTIGAVFVLRDSSVKSEARPPASEGRSLASAPALAKCAELFVVGQKIDDAKAQQGCLDPDGGIQGIGSFRCNDGRHLYSVDASTGAKEGWGFGGEVYHATKDAASDPAYGKAYSACNG